MNLRLPRVSPGDPITAEHLNAVYSALSSLGITVGSNSGLTLQGDAISLSEPPGFWARVDAHSAALYTWVQQLPQDSGTWTDGPMAGKFPGDTSSTAPDDPIYVIGGNTAVVLGSILRVWRNSQGELVGLAGPCP